MTDETFERRVAAGLQRAGEIAQPPEPDGWTDLLGRVERAHRRRQRALAATLALSLVAGPLVGVAWANRNEQHDTVNAVDAPSGSAACLPVVDRATTESSGGATSGSDTAVPDDQKVVGPYGTVGQLGPRFFRDVGGTRLRVYGQRYSPYQTGVPFWDPPGDCFPSGLVVVEASTAAVAGVVSMETFDELSSPASGWLQVVGVDEGDPQWVLPALVPSGTRHVRATFPGGAHDAMEPINGIVVLTVPAPGVTWNDFGPESGPSATLDITTADGSVQTKRIDNVQANAMQMKSAPAVPRPECQPPTALPPPGGEQPADVGAAKASIQNSFDEGRGDDDAEIADERDQVKNSSAAKSVGKTRWVVDEVSFDTPHHAWIKFTLYVEGSDSPYFTRFGEAVDQGGQWSVANDTWCDLFSLAGVTCN